jgi:nicotinate-nucleotide--dimethylbenzimidazole phosphoribosyltransferase
MLIFDLGWFWSWQSPGSRYNRLWVVWRRSSGLGRGRARRHSSCSGASWCGAIIAARTQSIPVIVDGFVATVAAAILAAQRSGAIDHVLLSGSDGSAAHARLIAQLGLSPLLDLNIQTSDGLGGLLAAQLLRAAADLHTAVPTATQLADARS